MTAFWKGSLMAEPQHIAFDAPAFLAEAGLGRKIIQLKPKQAFFSQGGPADSIFYLQSGRAKLTVFSEKGKEATITLFAVGDFIGEESLATVGGLRCRYRLYSTEDREGGDGPRDARGAFLLRPICEISAGPQHANPG
jgi:CRP-like cAMP-binding protein